MSASSVVLCCLRMYTRGARPSWLITFNLGFDAGPPVAGVYVTPYPQAFAVVDDFGTLVLTEWLG